MPKKIQIERAPVVKGSRYPQPYDLPCRERLRRRLGRAADLTQFGVNLTRLPPGAWSSQRHWHRAEDEFVYVLDGELVLVSETGEEPLRAGDCVGFKAGIADAHHLQNRSDRDALFLEIGTSSARSQTDEQVDYPDIDLRWAEGSFRHRDGTPYVSTVVTPPVVAPPKDRW